MTCIVNPGAPLATTATPRVGEDQKVRRRLSAFDERSFARERVATHLHPSGGRIAVERAERQRDHGRALVDVFEQRACGVRLLRGKREVGCHGPEQRRRARGASQFLEDQHDFAQSRLRRLGAEGREALAGQGAPQCRYGLGIVRALQGLVGRPVPGKKFAH